MRKISRSPVRNVWNRIQFGQVSAAAFSTWVTGGVGSGGAVGVGGGGGVTVGSPGGVVGVGSPGVGVGMMSLGVQTGSTSPCAALQLACRLPFTGLPFPWSP